MKRISSVISKTDDMMLSPQEKSLKFLNECDPKPIIAIDLDYTIWPINCFEQTAPPYSLLPISPTQTRNFNDCNSFLGKRGDLDSARDPSSVNVVYPTSVYCRDRRNNSTRMLSLYEEVRDVLEWCVDHDVVLTICSKSPEKSAAEGILKALGMWEWFLLPQIFNARKSHHFRNIIDVIGVDYSNFVFFDDALSNVSICNTIGIACCLVDKQRGLNWNTFLRGIELFRSNQQSKKMLSLWMKRNQTNNLPMVNPIVINDAENTDSETAASSVTSLISITNDLHHSSISIVATDQQINNNSSIQHNLSEINDLTTSASSICPIHANPDQIRSNNSSNNPSPTSETIGILHHPNSQPSTHTIKRVRFEGVSMSDIENILTFASECAKRTGSGIS